MSSNQKQMIEFIKSFSGQAHILTIPRVYIELCKGSHRAALLLSQCIYWSDRTDDPSGWFHKSYREWHEELGIPHEGVDTAMGILVKQGLAESETKSNNVKFYRPRMGQIVAALQELIGHVGDEGLPQAAGEGIPLAAGEGIPLARVRDSLRGGVRENSKPTFRDYLTEITTYGGAEERPAPAPVPSDGKSSKDRERDPLFDALAEVCEVDPATAGPSIGKVEAVLKKSKPPYTDADVKKFGEWWWGDDWRRKQANPPTLWKLQEQIGIIRSGGTNGHHRKARRTTQAPGHAVTDEQRRRAERYSGH